LKPFGVWLAHARDRGSALTNPLGVAAGSGESSFIVSRERLANRHLREGDGPWSRFPRMVPASHFLPFANLTWLTRGSGWSDATVAATTETSTAWYPANSATGAAEFASWRRV